MIFSKQSPKNQPTSQGKRLANWLIDGIVNTVIAYYMNYVVGQSYVLAYLESPPPTFEVALAWALVAIAAPLFAVALYFIGMEASFQRTIAKFVTGTRVVASDGSKPTFGQIIGRTLARFIPFEPFSFLTNGFPIGWHDMLSDTRVVDA